MKKALISTLFGVSLAFAKPYTIDKANSSVWFGSNTSRSMKQEARLIILMAKLI